MHEQFAGPNGMPIFARLSRLRRQRNATEYPGPGSLTITSDDASSCLTTADEILETARRLLESGRLGRWA